VTAQVLWDRTRRHGRCSSEERGSVSASRRDVAEAEQGNSVIGNSRFTSSKSTTRRSALSDGHLRLASIDKLWARHFTRRDFGSHAAELRLRKLCSFVTVRPAAFLDPRRSLSPKERWLSWCRWGGGYNHLGLWGADISLPCGAPRERLVNCD